MRRYGAATALRFQSPHLSDSEVRSTLDDFRKYYPNEISHELLAIDYFSAQHEWTSAFAAIDRLNDYIGGDPYLHQLRGNVHYRKGDYESAHREFAVACTAVPDQPMVWLGAIAVALVEREHDEVLNLMILADKSARMDWDSVGTFTGWIDFESSPQFDKWIAYLKK